MRGALVLGLSLLACEGGSSAAPAAAAQADDARRAARVPELMRGPSGGTPIAPFVAGERERAQQQGRPLLVYVGARWCEPCRYFHDALTQGQLDTRIPPVRFVEFDLDDDRDALAAAGYSSAMIPLFAAPAADGRGTNARLFGSIKGPGAVDDIVPRLLRLLGDAR